ncbi:hypothetical protein [Bacillus sp. FJAT-45037]|uniref:hypothetical protein n=1 Tax=Bacillus sp. FJAT-45037 TaxID=2011007 RepID=UPI0012FE3F89|nr:hypothetical protein [Bacillus sp. FJAT-45037]
MNRIFTEQEVDQVANGISQFFERYRNKRQHSIVQEKKLTHKKRKFQSKNWGKWKKRK